MRRYRTDYFPVITTVHAEAWRYGFGTARSANTTAGTKQRREGGGERCATPSCLPFSYPILVTSSASARERRLMRLEIKDKDRSLQNLSVVK